MAGLDIGLVHRIHRQEEGEFLAHQFPNYKNGVKKLGKGGLKLMIIEDDSVVSSLLESSGFIEIWPGDDLWRDLGDLKYPVNGYGTPLPCAYLYRDGGLYFVNDSHPLIKKYHGKIRQALARALGFSSTS